MFRHLLLPAVALAAAALMLGCSGLDTNNDNLPPPAIFAAAQPGACGTAGSTAIALDLTSVQIVEGFPQTSQQGANRVTVRGTVTGLAASDALFALVVDSDLTCPIARQAAVTPAADGSFTAIVGIAELQEFRVVVVAGPVGATVLCADASDCLQMDNAGTVVSVSGISNSAGVRLQ